MLPERMAEMIGGTTAFMQLASSVDERLTEMHKAMISAFSDAKMTSEENEEKTRAGFQLLSAKIDKLEDRMEEEKVTAEAKKIMASFILQKIPMPHDGNDQLRRDINRYFPANRGLKITKSARNNNLAVFIEMPAGTTFQMMLQHVLDWKASNKHLRTVSLDNSVPTGWSPPLKALKQAMSARDEQEEGRPKPYTVYSNLYRGKLIVTVERGTGKVRKIIGYIAEESIEEKMFQGIPAIKPDGTWIHQDQVQDMEVDRQGARTTRTNQAPAVRRRRSEVETNEALQMIAGGAPLGEARRGEGRTNNNRTNAKATEQSRAKTNRNAPPATMREAEKRIEERRIIQNLYQEVRDSYPDVGDNWIKHNVVIERAEHIFFHGGRLGTGPMIGKIRAIMNNKKEFKQNDTMKRVIYLLEAMEDQLVQLGQMDIDNSEVEDAARRRSRAQDTLRVLISALAKRAFIATRTSPFEGLQKYLQTWAELGRFLQYAQGKWEENDKQEGMVYSRCPQEANLNMEGIELSCQMTESMNTRYLASVLAGDLEDGMEHAFDDLEMHVINYDSNLKALYNGYLSLGKIKRHPCHIDQPCDIDEDDLRQLLGEDFEEETEVEYMEAESTNTKRGRSEESTPVKPRKAKARAVTTPYTATGTSANLSVQRSPEDEIPKPQRSKRNLNLKFGDQLTTGSSYADVISTEGIRPIGLDLGQDGDVGQQATFGTDAPPVEEADIETQREPEVEDRETGAKEKTTKKTRSTPTLMGKLAEKSANKH